MSSLTKLPEAVSLSPSQRAWQRFKRNRLGYWSLVIFCALVVLSLFAELISNDRPLIVRYEGTTYFPMVKDYSEKTFGGDFDTTTDYLDPFIRERLAKAGLLLRPSVSSTARPWPLLPAQALDLMRIVQEAVTNAVKHADAKTIDLKADTDAQHGVRIEIQDDGAGFDTTIRARGRGLKHMASRTTRMGGVLDMKSTPGHGVHLVIAIPIRPAPAPTANV